MIMGFVKNYLIVDNETNDLLGWYDSLKVAKQAIKERYPNDRIVRAVYYEYENGDASRWACGADFEQAKRNFNKHIFDNWSEF